MAPFCPFAAVVWVEITFDSEGTKGSLPTRRNDGSVSYAKVVVVVVVSHIQGIGCQPEKLLYTVANPARGLLNRGKREQRKSLMFPIERHGLR